MNAETLDRLLMDRSLAALPPDTAELLEAYLRHNPVAAGQARCYAETVDTVRQAWPPRSAGALPPFPADRIRQSGQRQRRWHAVQRYTGLAAALVLGVGLGSWWVGPAVPVATRDQVPHVFTATERAVGTPGAVGGGFWSAARIYATRKVSEPAKADHVIWDSPVTRPRLEGEL